MFSAHTLTFGPFDLFATQVLPAAGAFTDPVELATRTSFEVILWITYLSAGAAGFPSLQWSESNSAFWFQATVEDAAITKALPVFENAVGVAQKDFPPPGAGVAIALAYRVRSTGTDKMRFQFAEGGAVGTPGTITVTASVVRAT